MSIKADRLKNSLIEYCKLKYESLIGTVDTKNSLRLAYLKSGIEFFNYINGFSISEGLENKSYKVSLLRADRSVVIECDYNEDRYSLMSEAIQGVFQTDNFIRDGLFFNNLDYYKVGRDDLCIVAFFEKSIEGLWYLYTEGGSKLDQNIDLGLDRRDLHDYIRKLELVYSFPFKVRVVLMNRYGSDLFVIKNIEIIRVEINSREDCG